MTTSDLRGLGWGPLHEQQFKMYRMYRGVSCEPGRVARRSHDVYTVLTASGARMARVSGRYRYEAVTSADYPVVGDWVALRLPATVGEGSQGGKGGEGDEGGQGGEGVIEGLVPRQSAISRRAAAANGKIEEQVLAANVDIVFLVSSLNQEFNPRRIERYLVTAWESGATPVLVLNKADLCADPQEYLDLLGPSAVGLPVHLTSAATGQGLEALTSYVGAGRTVAFLGSSGVGKSSLINRLAGRDVQATGGIRDDDDHGRHITTRSDLILLPDGGILVDTPGLRELALWSRGGGLDSTFVDITEMAQDCRFRDCQHQGEPGCAVRAALEAGRLAPEHLAAYRKLQGERAFLRSRQNRQQMLARQRWQKQLAKATRELERRANLPPRDI